MSYSYVTYTGDGTTQDYIVPFPYLKISDVKVSLDEAEQNALAYSWHTSGTIRFVTAPPNGASIRIQRITDKVTPAVDFRDGSTLTEADHDLVFALLDLLGTPVEVETRLLSVAGTVGGCSPAFIAMVIEALADAAVKHGIPRATAYPMVSQMMVGTAKLQLATGMHPGAMKDAVCSPGGTTIRGVAELEAAGMRSAFIRAIDAIEG